MHIRIKAMVAGKPAYIEGEIADARWLADDETGETLVETMPDSIIRVDLYDDDGRKVWR
jgi:hypothetical protein